MPGGPPPSEPPVAPGLELESRLEDVEWAVSRLTERTLALERARPSGASEKPVATEPVPADPQSVALLRQDVDALLTGEALATDAGRGRLKEVVRLLQDEIASERRKERAAAREVARQERLQQFFQEAQLSAGQEHDLTRALDEETQKRNALVAEGREGRRPREEVQKLTRQLRDLTQEQAKRILRTDQFVKFEEYRREERRTSRLTARGE